MGTPKDAQRIDAFKNFVRHVGGVSWTSGTLKISPRAIRRMMASEPPPVSLLEELTALALEWGATKLARQLAEAARWPGQADA